MSALFPDDGPEITAQITPPSGLNYRLAGQVKLRECQRCWAWVANLSGHQAWHGSVDTGATVKLAGSALVRNAEPCAACGTTADICSERRRRHEPLCCPDCDRIDGHRERI